MDCRHWIYSITMWFILIDSSTLSHRKCAAFLEHVRQAFTSTSCIVWHHKWHHDFLNRTSAVFRFITYHSYLCHHGDYDSRSHSSFSRSWFLVPFSHTVVWYFAMDSVAMFWSYVQKKERLRELSWKRKVEKFVRKKWSFLFHHIFVLTVGYTVVVVGHLHTTECENKYGSRDLQVDCCTVESYSCIYYIWPPVRPYLFNLLLRGPDRLWFSIPRIKNDNYINYVIFHHA